MQLKEILLEIENYKGILDYLDAYLDKFAPVGNRESLIKYRNIRTVSNKYMGKIEARLNYLFSQLQSLDYGRNELSELIEYFDKAIEDYRRKNKETLAKIDSQINKTALQDSNLVLEMTPANWDVVSDASNIDSIYASKLDSGEVALFVSFQKKDRQDNFYIDSGNASFDNFKKKFAAHTDKDTIIFTDDRAVANVKELQIFLDNYNGPDKKEQTVKTLLITEKEVNILDEIAKSILSGQDNRRRRDSDRLRDYFESICDNPDKVVASYLFLEKRLTNYMEINPLRLTYTKCVTILSTVIAAISLSTGMAANVIASLSNFGIQGAFSIKEIIDDIKVNRQKYGENLNLLGEVRNNITNNNYNISNNNNFSEVREERFSEPNHVKIKLADGSTIELDHYMRLKKKFSLDKRRFSDGFKFITEFPDRLRSKETVASITTVIASIILISTVIASSLKFDCEITRDHAHLYRDPRTNYTLYGSNHYEKIGNLIVQEDAVIYPDSEEEKFIYKQQYAYVKDNVNQLINNGGNVGDFLLEYEYSYTVTETKTDKDGKVTIETHTKYDWTSNPNHYDRTGLMRMKFISYLGYNVDVKNNGKFKIDDGCYYFNITDMIDNALIFNPRNVVGWRSQNFRERNFGEYFDPTKLTNNVGAYDIPNRLLERVYTR